jgi:surface antigen
MLSLKDFLFRTLSLLKSPIFYLILFLTFFFILRGKPEKKISLEIFREKFSHPLYLSPLPKYELPDLVLVQKNSIQSLPSAFIAPKSFATLVGIEEPEKREILEYEVKEGDSLWSIAQNFGISIETIVWANDLENLLIKPGQKLLILPVSGVIHIVKEGETIEEIAKKYKANVDDILEFNDISENEIFTGQLLVIPGGKMTFVQKIETVPVSQLSTNNFYGKSHAYPYGQCTWWVAQKRPVPSWGNAREWLVRASLSGYLVCQGNFCQPQVGAIISLRTTSPYGHVGYVENVQDGKVIFSEMNYIGWGKVNYRSLKIGDPRILGYIY